MPEHGASLNAGKCRFCERTLRHSFCDLGMSPLSNAFIRPEQLYQAETTYPLHAFVCESCYLVQLQTFKNPDEIFKDYIYFSSTSESWLEHAKKYTDEMVSRFGLGQSSKIVEVASNDGYLLRNFKERGIPVLGVEPAENVAKIARDKGIPTLSKFFGSATAGEMIQEGMEADLLLGNNVLAHVPDLNDFVMGLKILLKTSGVITMEFPHLLRLMEGNEFDTIYHEHFSYFSFITAEKIFARYQLKIFDVQELRTHGGSLRIYAAHSNDKSRTLSQNVNLLKSKEIKAGLDQLKTYSSFAKNIQETKQKLLTFLMRAKRKGKTIVGYGAPAKGNTLLNHCGIGKDLLDYTVDRSPYKQGLYLPGSHLPVFHPDKIRETQPDYVLVLPWNIKDEIMQQMSCIRSWGGEFIVPIPKVQVL